MRLRSMLAGCALALGVLAGGPALAQPAAPPGTICIVPGGWCWAISPGISGQPCQCPTQDGWVAGTYS